MGKECDGIRNEIIKMIWYMRGSISYNEGMQLSTKERGIISELVKDNLETTKKTKLPFF